MWIQSMDLHPPKKEKKKQTKKQTKKKKKNTPHNSKLNRAKLVLANHGKLVR